MALTWLDWIWIALYFALNAAVGFYYRARAGKSVDEFFLSGRNVPWWLAGTSMVATTFAADTPLAVTGMVARGGIAGNWLWWSFVAGGMLTVFFYARLWRRSGVMTDIEFTEIRYSGKPAAFLRGFRALYLGIPFNCIVLGWVNLAMVKILTLALGVTSQSAARPRGMAAGERDRCRRRKRGRGMARRTRLDMRLRVDLWTAVRGREVAARRNRRGDRSARDGRGRRSGDLARPFAPRMERGERMKRVYLLFIAASAFGAPMPIPATVVPGEGALQIDSSFALRATAYSDSRLESAMHRLVDRVSRQTGIEIRGGNAVLSIDCAGPAPEYPTLGEDESYQLDVTRSAARIKAATVTGAMRGMETFAELIEKSEAKAVHIEDRPRFPWRGLMMDVSRHWMPVPVVLRNLDAMAAVKLNVFHWHLSDDQGFRVESKRFPKLHELGSDGHFYTQDEIRRVIDYARDRGIRVIPEFDMPGHTTSWFVGYPELANAPGPYEVERGWGIFHAVMDPSREETYTFLDAFIGEMAALFPDRYFHIGGDEVEPVVWNGIQGWASQNGLKDARAIQAYFNQRVQKILAKYGKTMIGWDEVFDTRLDRQTVIQSWRGQAALADAAGAGFRGILSFGYYLDHLTPASYHYSIDPDPNGEHKSEILGGEACMWAEYVNAETVDSRIWPRMAAIAERFWSPASVNDVDSMYARLESVSRMLEWTGLIHRSNYQPMLDRISADHSDALRVLADASEALGIDGRRRARRYTSLVDLNRFVDAVRPESESVRKLEKAARLVQTDPRAESELRAALTQWAENDARFEAPPDLATLSKNLSILGSIGLQTLEFLKGAQTAPDGWVDRQLAALKEIEKPSAEVNLAAIRPVRILIDAVASKRLK